MKTKNDRIKLICLLLLAGLVSSCTDFLDTMPDNRTQLDSEKKITELLVSAYPTANYSVLAELSSDNFVDNNSILPVVLTSFDKMHDEIYAWQDVTASTEEDSPSFVWESCYKAIAAANHALKAIDELHAMDSTVDMSAQRGEALMCRAYNHFILVNIFCQAYKDDNASTSDVGIPYVTEPETVVNRAYIRENVSSVYSKIQQDIEAGIDLINDQNYSVPKYHFNKAASSAFAARFFLYKRDYAKVVQYATNALSGNPAAKMRNWSVDYDNITTMGYDYINTQNPCNFLLLPTRSVFDRIFGTRYGNTSTAMASTTFGSGPTWNNFLPCFEGKLKSIGENYSAYLPKSIELFEYTDKIAGIGYAHVVKAEFTAEETLLCRAEALIFLNRISDAIADLQIWNKSHEVNLELTAERIKNFYVPSNTVYVNRLNASNMSTQFSISAAQLPYVNCVLHFRRIETIYDGQRWFDIKRYGIEIEHAIATKEVDKLTYNDARRAIQVPQEVISAGLESNPRLTSVFDNRIFEKIVR